MEPAVEAAHAVLQAALATGVRLVVQTSSTAAITEELGPADKVYSEDDWNYESNLTFSPSPFPDEPSAAGAR